MYVEGVSGVGLRSFACPRVFDESDLPEAGLNIPGQQPSSEAMGHLKKSFEWMLSFASGTPSFDQSAEATKTEHKKIQDVWIAHRLAQANGNLKLRMERDKQYREGGDPGSSYQMFDDDVENESRCEQTTAWAAGVCFDI